MFVVSILKQLDALEVVVVAAAGNNVDSENLRPIINAYLAKFLGEGKYKNLIVVGAADRDSESSYFNKAGEFTTYAPGENVRVAWANTEGQEYESGTSLGKLCQGVT